MIESCSFPPLACGRLDLGPNIYIYIYIYIEHLTVNWGDISLLVEVFSYLIGTTRILFERYIFSL